MYLYFENAKGVKRLIARVKNQAEAYDKIQNFCIERNFNIFYTRSWTENGVTTFDVGSHSEFFLLSDKELVEEKQEKKKKISDIYENDCERCCIQCCIKKTCKHTCWDASIRCNKCKYEER